MLLLLITCLLPVNVHAEDADSDVSGNAVSTEIVCGKVTYPAVEEPPIQQEKPNVQGVAQEGEEGIVTIGESNVPFSAPMTYPHWSLMNLLLVYADIIIWIAMILIAIRPKHRIFYPEQVMVQGIGLHSFFEIRSRKRWIAIGAILALTGLLLYILTQDFNGAMTYFDTWSACYAFLTVGLIVTASLLVRAVSRYSVEGYAG